MAAAAIAGSWYSKPSPITSQHPPLFSKIGLKLANPSPKPNYLIFRTRDNYFRSSSTRLNATLKNPKGFGRSPKRSKKTTTKKKTEQNNEDEEEDDDEDTEEEEEEEEGIIPEIVTNRMISRMGFTVGVPLFMGLLFFPFFYYLKVGLKIDVPTWVPFIESFVFFGTALAGVSYGIVSSSWDPMREGSLLGWNEAQKNWPVFWRSLRGGSRKN
ncbi:protein PAM68, chloroplastic [Argentina anserina]|uniref:protein PAM68, chloroplastic n=1 Tax=Argentina anserina TaxID=57926 RepID=UPI00217669AD|nr:protein PAM68, chloroplastic [Potentilla anserina]